MIHVSDDFLEPVMKPYYDTLRRNSAQGILIYKVFLLRDPISLKIAMAVASIVLGLSFSISSRLSNATAVLTALLPIGVWGFLFFTTGVACLIAILWKEYSRVKIAISSISLFLWVLLNVSSYHSPTFDALNGLLFVTVIFELWIFVHAITPHTRRLRITDYLTSDEIESELRKAGNNHDK